MSTSSGQDKPHSISKNVIFSCLISIYFSPFFFEHPVDISLNNIHRDDLVLWYLLKFRKYSNKNVFLLSFEIVRLMLHDASLPFFYLASLANIVLTQSNILLVLSTDKGCIKIYDWSALNLMKLSLVDLNKMLRL